MSAKALGAIMTVKTFWTDPCITTLLTALKSRMPIVWMEALLAYPLPRLKIFDVNELHSLDSATDAFLNVWLYDANHVGLASAKRLLGFEKG